MMSKITSGRAIVTLSAICIILVALIAFTIDGGEGNMDTVLGQYGVNRFSLSSTLSSASLGKGASTSAEVSMEDLEDEALEQEFEYDETPDSGSNGKVFDEFNAVEFDANRKQAILPRTLTSPYNDVKLDGSKQYFLYSPSGGFNNQILCFLAAISVARENNYTLIVPPGGKHSNFEMGYYRQPVETTVPMDQLMDLASMSRGFGIEMIALNGTLADFHQNVLGGGKTSNDIVTYLKWPGKMKDASERIVANTRAKASAATTPVVFAKGRWYSGGRRFFEPWYHKHVRYSPYLLKLSLLISSKFFNNDFDAYHVRLGDYSKKAKLSARDASGFVDFGLSNGFERGRPVYLATDGSVYRNGEGLRYENWFKPFEAFKTVIPETRLLEDEQVALAMLDFKNRLPASDVYRDIFGTVEQLVCARARTFVGTSVSTFTKTIVQKRVHLTSAIPDMKRESWPWSQGKTFTIRWSGHMVFHSLTQNLQSGETPDVEWNARSKKKSPSVGRALQAVHDEYLASVAASADLAQ